MPPIFAIYLVWFVWAVTWLGASLWVAPTIKRASITHDIIYRLVMFIGFMFLFGLYTTSYEIQHRLWPLLRGAPGWTMVVLVVAGAIFSWAARIQIGSLWSGSITRKANHHVVVEGPYALVRHPIYTGTMLAAFATAIATGTPSSFLGAAIMTVGWFVKARLEERFLREELGPDTYNVYANRVPMFVPFARLPMELIHRYLQHI